MAKGFVQKILKPNDVGDWLNQRSACFADYINTEPKDNFNDKNRSFFNVIVIGVSTNRDAWVCNYSDENLKNNIGFLCKNYNKERVNYVKNKQLTEDKKFVSWTVNLKKDAVNNKVHRIDIDNIDKYYYRPFVKQFIYYDRAFIERPGKWNKLYPALGKNNIVICVSGVGSSKNFSVLLSDKLVSLDYNEKTQCFPLYWYEEKQSSTEQDIFAMSTEPQEKEYIRHDGITDYILQEAREKYRTNAITKEDIFYYVYGFLHSEDYRRQFAADLKKMLPRLPLVDNAVDFKAFSEAGRKLADLHLNYEKRPKPEQVIVERNADDYIVEKMKFKSKQDKSVIIYNNHITIKNIPLEAYDYVVNGRSAIEWIMERYQVKIDKASEIKNDPNDWAKEHNDPTYILDLLLSVITVSIETMKIVKDLPKVKFE